MIRRIYVALVSSVLIYITAPISFAVENTLTHYQIDVTLDSQQHRLYGSELVTYTNRFRHPISEIYFILAANHSREENPYVHDITNDDGYWNGWEPESTNIDYVRYVDDKPIQYSLERVPAIFQTFSLDNVLLKITLDHPLLPGAQQQLKIGFNTVFPQKKSGDEAYWQGIYTWRFGWNPIELAMEGDEWFRTGYRLVPGNYAVTLRAPKSFATAAGASIKKVISEDGSFVTYYFESTVPQVSLPFTAGPSLQKIENNSSPIKIESWYRPGHQETARWLADLAQEIIAFYQPRFGKYRYQNLVVAETSAPFTAMAADGLVLIMESTYRYRNVLVPGILNRVSEYVLAHEIGHLWWGVATPPDFGAENWLSEAFANYLAYTYIEAKYGKDKNYFDYDGGGWRMSLLNYFLGDLSFRQSAESTYLEVFRLGWDEEIAKPLDQVQYGNALAARTYEKGYWVLRALENEMGQEKLLTALKDTFNEYQGKNLTIRDFQTVCERTSGQELDWFFQQWVFGRAYLDYRIDDVRSMRTENQFQTTVEIHKSGDAIAHVPLIATTESGQQITSTLSSENVKNTVQFETSEKIVSVQIDPQQKIPDVYRIDNTWPRPVKVKFGVSDNPLDAYSIRYYFLPSSVELPAEGSATLGLGIGVAGGYGPTHQWSVASAFGIENDKTYLSQTANYDYRFNAQHSIVAEFNTTGYEPKRPNEGTSELQFGHQLTLFESPPLGSSSRLLLPSNRLTNSLVRLDHRPWYQYKKYQMYQNEYDGPIALWRVNYVRNDIVRYAWTNQIKLDVAPPTVNTRDYYKLSVRSTKNFRLVPNWILTIDAQLGATSSATPTPEKFDFTGLKGGYGEHFRRSWLETHLNLDFPLQRELELTWLNIASLKAIYGNFFTNVGALGGEFRDIDSVRVAESGAQLKFQHTTFGGMFDFDINIGYAFPWYQRNTAKSAKGGVFLRLGAAMPL